MLPFIWGTLRAGLAVIVDQVDRLFEVTADQGKAITFLPRIFADERRSKAKAFTAKDAKQRKGGRSR
jgi:hypothetical protein